MARDTADDADPVSVVRAVSEVLDGLSVAVCVFDPDMRTLLWNRTFLKLFPEHDGHVRVGEPYSANLRRFYAVRLDADEMPHIDRYIADGIARATAQRLPFVFKHRGQWLRVASLAVGSLGRIRIWTAIPPPEGDPMMLNAVVQVTSGEAAQAIEDFADGMMLVGADGRISAVNDRLLLLYHLGSRADAVGRSYRDMLALLPGDAAERDQALVAAADNQRFAGAPFEVPLPDARWIRVIEHRAVDGTIVSTHSDVTETRRLQRETEAARRRAEALNQTLIDEVRERERAEQALREANAQLRHERTALSEANRWLSLAKQIAHVGHWRLELPSRRMSWSDDADRTEAPRRGGWERFETALEDAIARRDCFQVAFEVERGGGEIRHVLARGAPQFDAAGQLESFFGVVVDQTEQRRAEDKLRQFEKMQVIGGLAAGVAHDFNNILQVVMGNLALIADDLPASSPSVAHAADALSEAKRGADLTHNLLAYARRQVLTPMRLNVPELLRDLQGFLARTLGARIAVELETEPASPEIMADRAELQTALMNLAINASHAMPEGGRLRLLVRTQPADPRGELPAGAYVVIEVADSGSGMTAEVCDRAFDPFFTTKGNDGLGLGLPMVQGFSQQSGGDTRIFSEPGAGTRVEIWLPALAPAAPAAPVAVAESGCARGRVLVVDDQPAVLTLLALMLERAGFAVLRAANGRDALDFLAADAALDAIVTDFTMPGLTGVELIRRAQEIRPGMPSLIITGFAEIAGFDPTSCNSAIVTKPIRRDAFVAAVEKMMARARSVVAQG